MSLKGLVQENVMTVDIDASIVDAAKMMLDRHVGNVVVVEKMNSSKSKPLGIITDRDVALLLAKRGRIDSKMKVEDGMTRNLILGTMDDGVYETIRKMRENGIQRMPIVDRENQLVGIICADDFLKLLGEEIQQLSQVIESERSREGLKSGRPAMETEQVILQT